MSSRSLLPSTGQAHRDAAYRFAVGALYFAVISGVGSLIALLFGPFGIVVSVLVSLVGVYYGGIEVARGVDIVVRYALAESRAGADSLRRGTAVDDTVRGDADQPDEPDTRRSAGDDEFPDSATDDSSDSATDDSSDSATEDSSDSATDD
ncbi:hypothetical protein [Halobellus rufus]|uniref:hypothetical protein n=1 Tax=Halobellus rufus TaxID=1448860 RepID=UPI000679717E|nr:hypothetical protein [Halobellus rufus]